MLDLFFSWIEYFFEIFKYKYFTLKSVRLCVGCEENEKGR